MVSCPRPVFGSSECTSNLRKVGFMDRMDQLSGQRQHEALIVIKMDKPDSLFLLSFIPVMDIYLVSQSTVIIEQELICLG